MFRSAAPLALAIFAAFPAAAQTAPQPSAAAENAVINAELPAGQAAMKAHVMFLASDAMRGRDAGSPEYDIAAQYVASQFYAQGLRPAGDDGSYLQKVPLVSYKVEGQGSATIARKGGAPVALAFGTDYLPAANPASAETSVAGEVVFVGYGISAPSLGRDDYKGANVQGKIVAFFGGAPDVLPGEERAHLGSVNTKAVTAAGHGAIGYIMLDSPKAARTRPFAAMAGYLSRPRMVWADQDGKGHVPAPGTPALGMLSVEGAAKLFEGARTSWAEVAKLAEDGNARFKPVNLKGTLSFTTRTGTSPVTSYNVAGLLPGSDPVLKDEIVVLTAHLDHVGTGKPDATGDTIYNGAMDNAVGIASLIEEAKRFKASGKAPRRSILFLAVTAEEKGLVGSDYFAHNPTLPKENLVANVNLDMPLLTYKFEDVVVFGAARSTLGPIVERAAAGIGVTMSPDPMPDEGLFVRSDHYRFVQQGIPSVFLWPGHKGPGKAAFDIFFAKHYHQPSDEIVQAPPIDWASGVRFIEVNYRIAREIADAEARPVWNKGDFFGTLYNGLGAK